MIAAPAYREAAASDLEPAFELSQRAIRDALERQGVVSADGPQRGIRGAWKERRSLVEFLAAQPGCAWVCEDGGELIGYARTIRFGELEQLSELAVDPASQHHGVGRKLLQRCWPGAPTPELGRVVIAAGAPNDLSLYTDFGVMPAAGHWHMRSATDEYRECRSLEVDAAEPSVVALSVEHAVREWKRLEPPALEHHRPELHEFFGRDRACLATLDAAGEARAICWVSSSGEVGPAVAATPEELVPVVLQTLDRVAKAQEPETISVSCTSTSWWLIRRLRTLGFRVHRGSWVLCSIPLPGLDRYMPTRPAIVL